MNTPVSFEIAKLLKEKGFDDFTQIWYQHGEGISGCVEGKRDYYNRKGDIYTSAPTISDVVMWLYEKYGIWVSSQPFIRHNQTIVWLYDIFKNNYIIEQLPPSKGVNSPTKAYEAAIEYCLTELKLDI